MKCPFCSYEESKVIDSRSADDGERIRRRRECLKCGKRFTTYEKVESIPLIVVKKDKTRQQFDRQKLLKQAFLSFAILSSLSFFAFFHILQKVLLTNPASFVAFFFCNAS